MNYELYKKFFDGSFFPVNDPDQLVNLESTGEFSVRSITGSGVNVKRVEHYLPSTIGLTNMLNSFTGGSRFEALTSHSNFFIPEIYNCTSYSGVQKAIINYFAQREKPYVVDAHIADRGTVFLKATYEDTTYRIDWGDGKIQSGVIKVGESISKTYLATGGTSGDNTIRIWSNNQAVELSTNGGHFKAIKSPFHINMFVGSNSLNTPSAYFGVTIVEETDDYPIWKVMLNINSGASPYDGTTAIAFGDIDKIPVHFNTGIADFTNLSKYTDSLELIEIVAKDLYFDWGDLSFTHQLTIDVYPDDLTAKTTIDYFARQTYTAGLPNLMIYKGNGQEEIYQYALTKTDKFASITKEA